MSSEQHRAAGSVGHLLGLVEIVLQIVQQRSEVQLSCIGWVRGNRRMWYNVGPSHESIVSEGARTGCGAPN